MAGSPPPFTLHATSGRDWHFTPIRPLSRTVQLVRDTSHPNAAPLIVKTVTPPSENALRTALDDVAVWRRAHAAEPDLILPLLDIVVARPSLHFITPYCPGGDLAHSPARSERAALRLIAGLATALEAVIAVSSPPVHANLSAAHVLLDHAAAPRLAGWGLTRSSRLRASRNAAPTEHDDVIALASILHHLLFGKSFDPERRGLPDSPQLSSSTRAVLEDVLLDGRVSLLTAFRYDIAAARKLVPTCGPPLAPVVNRRREQLLDADLDSFRGFTKDSQSTSTRPLSTPSPPIFETPNPRAPPRIAPKPRPVSMLPAPSSAATASTSTSTGDVASTPAVIPSAPNSNPAVIPIVPMEIIPTSFPTEAAVDDAVRAIAQSDLSPLNSALVESLLLATTATDSPIPEQIFKTMFRLPLSKNPLVALKATTLLHHLVSEGPAKLTALCLTNDGFFSWVESAWSRDRIQNKPGKIHMYTYCFAAGEIGAYVSMLRRRLAAHAQFSGAITTHWLIRVAPDGSPPPLDAAQRREAVRIILEVVEKSAAVLRRMISSRDPSMPVKTSVVPPLVLEITKAYHVLCWLFSTSDETQRRDMSQEIAVAHNATRGVMQALQTEPSVRERCHPHSLLELSEGVPSHFDSALIVTTLKKLKKRKKRKTERREAASYSTPQEDGGDIEENGNGYVSNSVETSESSQQVDDGNSEVTESRIRKKRSDKRDRNSTGAPKQDAPSENGSYGDGHSRHGGAIAPRPFVTADSATIGLKKLSLSVRREHGAPLSSRESRFAPPVGEHERQNGRQHSFASARGRDGQRSSSDEPHDREHAGSNRGRSQNGERHGGRGSDVDSDSGSEEDNPKPRRSRATKQRMEKSEGGRDGRKQRTRRKSSSESESDEHSESGSSSDSNRRRRRNPKNGRRRAEREEESDEEEEENKRMSSKKKATKKKKSDEKKIPFDKELRKADGGRASISHETGDDEYSGGSKEALEAAAQGRKTPKMNSGFEVAPYEVQFGPQIGSGGFGVVYKAKFRTETVAIKKIHGHALSNAASVAEFQSEVAVLCTLNHPNILRFVGACTKPPNLMIITEFMARGTLFDLLHQSQTRVTWAMRKKFALDTCKGMRYLHDSKLLHRDLKSSNLMLDKDFNCKVGDFGLTRISKGSAAVQMTGQCGTFQYMAVEVLANKPYSEKADVFSFGILLWEMVARKLPYFGMQPMQVGIAVVQQGLRPTIPPKCPAPLAKLMQACWDNDPTRRPSFAQLVEALDAMPE